MCLVCSIDPLDSDQDVINLKVAMRESKVSYLMLWVFIFAKQILLNLKIGKFFCII